MASWARRDVDPMGLVKSKYINVVKNQKLTVELFHLILIVFYSSRGKGPLHCTDKYSNKELEKSVISI